MIAAVLLVEDDESLRGIHQRLFERAGYLVESMGSLHEAKALVEQRFFDVAVVCLQLPNGDGFSLLSFIRDFSRRTVCIVLTAKDSANARDMAIALGAAAFLLKPVPPQILLDTVKDKLKQKSL